MQRTLAALGLAAAVLVGCGTLAIRPATAAADVQRLTYEQHFCVPFGDAVGCFDLTASSQLVVNGAVGMNHIEGVVCISYTYPSGDFTRECNARKATNVFQYKDGELQVVHDRLTTTFVSPDQTCVVDTRFHMANGTVQYSDFSVDCT